MRELLITIPVHKDRLSSLSRPFAVLQMFFCRPSVALHMSFNRSSCRPLLSFSCLSTCHQSFLLPSLCCPSVVPASLHPSLGCLLSMCPYERPRSDKQKPLGRQTSEAEGCMGSKERVTHPYVSCGICSCCR